VLPLGRRTALAAAPLAALAGCRWGPDETEEPDRPAPRPDRDAQAVDAAAEAIRQALDQVQQAATDHVGLATALTGLVAMHTAHLELLDVDDDGARASTAPAPGAAQALARVRATERELQATLAGLAQQADSGTFARALASMSASVAQHLAVLPAVPRGPA
jgi:hypothetical protein